MQTGYNLKFLVFTNTFPSTKKFGQYIVKGNTLQLMSRCCGTDLPLMHWWEENHKNPLQTQRAFISMVDWTQNTLMTFPRQERLRIKTFPFHTPSPKNNLRISKVLDFSCADMWSIQRFSQNKCLHLCEITCTHTRGRSGKSLEF